MAIDALVIIHFFFIKNQFFLKVFLFLSSALYSFSIYSFIYCDFSKLLSFHHSKSCR